MHSLELRARVIRAYETGEGSYAVLGARFAVAAATVKRWVRRFHQEGHLVPRPRGGGTPSTIDGAELRALLAQLGEPTAAELTAEFNQRRRRRARVHVSSIKRALRRHGFVVRKRADGRWRVADRPPSS